MPLRTARVLAAAALLTACASSPSPPPPARAPKLLPRSSVAAVLGHRGELGLDDGEVRRLEAIDAELERAQAAATAKGERPGAPTGAAPGTGARPPADPGAGPAHPRGARSDPRDALHAAPDPYAVVDRLDTEAYFRAEAALRPELRERARAVAERYREELYEERAARRTQRRP